MAIGQFLFGRPGEFQQIDRFGSGQQQGIMQALQQALAGMQDPTKGFEPIAQQARMGFEQQTLPSIAERFSGMNGQRSSAFSQALGQAGAGLESNLAAQQAQFGQQNLQTLLSMLGLGLTPTFETAYRPQEQGFIPGAINAFAQGIGAGMTGGAGAAGGNLISALMSLFGGRGNQQMQNAGMSNMGGM